MTMFNVATKAASALAIAAVAIEAHEMGARSSKRGFAQASADKFVRDSIGASKLNSDSAKHAEMKEFIENSDISDRIVEVGGGIGGYFTGLGRCIKNNLPTLGFGVLGLVAKTRPGKVIALAGMGAAMIFDTIVNATNMFERTDYLEN